jgi:hypothetical protein
VARTRIGALLHFSLHFRGAAHLRHTRVAQLLNLIIRAGETDLILEVP